MQVHKLSQQPRRLYTGDLVTHQWCQHKQLTTDAGRGWMEQHCGGAVVVSADGTAGRVRFLGR